MSRDIAGLFTVGCFRTPICLYSQMHRAFNPVALFSIRHQTHLCSTQPSASLSKWVFGVVQQPIHLLNYSLRMLLILIPEKLLMSRVFCFCSVALSHRSFRFQQKFQRIVQMERQDNFISKLHRGNLDIIPWPVIGSSSFYELFMGLKLRLDRQPLTHKHAGAFLSVLKMLMAKLKVSLRKAISTQTHTLYRRMTGGH